MIVCLDTETTGLDPWTDEILSLSIVDVETDEVLLDEMYRPARAKRWPGAQAVNGISPVDVATCPPIAESVPRIKEILSEASLIIAYNVDFDLPFLEAAGALPDTPLEVSDPMVDFAKHHSDWGRWRKLTYVADYIGYIWTGAAHGSLADTRAAAAVWRWLDERDEAITSPYLPSRVR